VMDGICFVVIYNKCGADIRIIFIVFVNHLQSSAPRIFAITLGKLSCIS
jgi:hypothetical protein